MKQSKLSLNDVEWGKFKIRDVFDVKNSKAYHKENLTIDSKGIPYITRTSLNNGVEDIISIDKHFITNKRNTISLGAENADFFYHEFEYITGNKMYSIYNENINKSIGLFLTQVFRTSIRGCGFGYGKGLTGTRFKDRVVLLPLDENNKPNWQFMEDYIKQEQKQIAQKVISYYEQKMLETSFDLVGLEDVEWKNFKIGDLFTFERKPSKGLNNLDIDTDSGISYLGATNRNNGVLEFVKPSQKLTYEGNCIAFIRNGEGSMGYSIYKKEDFIATQDISVGYNTNLDKYNGMFITTIADRVRGKYNFGYKRNQNRLENELLTLPAYKNGKPHWDYMSKFMQKLEAENLEKALEYIYIYRLAISYKYELTPLNQKEWKEFWLEDLVDIKSGKDIYKRERIDGDIPYITSTAQNNGIGYYVNNKNKTLEDKAISVNRNGSVGYAFYHNYKALYGNDTRKLIPKYRNKYTALFLTHVITKQKEKYGYGYKMGTGRLKRQKILLPIKKDGNIDYDYMKKYMQIEEIKGQYKILSYYYNILNV